MKIDIPALAHALKHAPHHWLGITPDPPDPQASPPAALITNRDLAAFEYSLRQATSYWPDASQFVLVGSDAERTQGGKDYPPNFKRLESPEILLSFEAGQPPDSDRGPGQELIDSQATEDMDIATTEAEARARLNK